MATVGGRASQGCRGFAKWRTVGWGVLSGWIRRRCGLKACLLAFVENNPDIVFRDRKYSDKCWTHDIGSLVALADLQGDRDADALANPPLGVNWGLVQGWSEKARYELKLEPEARRFYEAVTHNVNGVLPWIRIRW
jgi:hypothetical protein